MRSIKAKLIVFFGVLIGGICMGLSIISYINSSNALNSNLGKTLPKVAEQTANNIQGRLEGKLTYLEAVAAREDIKDINNSWENKKVILLDEVKRNGSIRMNIADKNGDAKTSDGKTLNVKDREYFQKALSGQSNVSDPVITKTDNSVSILYAVPIKNNDEIVGVLIETQDGNELSGLTDQVKFGQTGSGFMIKEDGVVIANPNRDLVIQMYNPIEESQKDSNLQGLASIEKKMISGDTGIGEYQYKGVDKFVAYAPVQGTDWSVGVSVANNEILSELSSLKISTLLSSIVFILIGLGVIYIIANYLSKGIKSTSKHLELLAEGNLCEEISSKYLQSKDEIGVMTSAMKIMQESLREMIERIKESSSSINGQSENLSS
ncbi:methyl-accepting chemotaxis protein McpA [Clostridium saccharobutylicum DSM 13864]|nr:methyl-accepting chemotaxis protein [Clostridium saccharobutylicum]OAV41025.1 methyl-accepting chemotaxis protein McpA [Clostridium saccharobutylicum DSM 13864]